MATKITTRFRELLKRPELLVMPGGFGPLHARMAEALGYEAFFMAGSQIAAYLYGLPDVGLIGFREMLEAARRLAAGSNIAIFADADTGYGNAVNVFYTVQQYLRAGVAGLHIEDQEAPKKSGTLAGRRLISLDRRSESTGPRWRRRMTWTPISSSAPAAMLSAAKAGASRARWSARSPT